VEQNMLGLLISS